MHSRALNYSWAGKFSFRLLTFVASFSLLLALALSCALTEHASATVTQETDTTGIQPAISRIFGDNASGTAAEIASQMYAAGETSEWVVIARDDDFADAMSATGLAGALNAPIILADRNTGLSDYSKAVIQGLKASKAYIIGGSGAIPADIESQLKAINVTPQAQRIFGDTYWETSTKCAAEIQKVDKENGVTPATDVIVAMGINFQDALSISSLAYKYHMPIYLETDGQGSSYAADRKLTDDAISAIKTTLGDSGKIYVPGGTGAVAKETVEDVFEGKDTVRIFGEDGYETSNEIARYFTSDAGGNKLDASYVCIANGAEAPKGTDALAGAALAGKRGGVILLANTNAACGEVSTKTLDGMYTKDVTDADGNVSTEIIRAFLSDNATSIQSVGILGGTYVMPRVVIDIVKANIWNWCKVEFESNEGSKVDFKKTWKGLTITKPTDPVRENYTFTGWFADAGLSKVFNFETVTIKKSTTLYAGWEAVSPTPEPEPEPEPTPAEKFTVKFVTYEGDANTPADQQVEKGSKATKPIPNPTRTGYTFDGWYTTSTFETAFDFDSAINADTTVYAKFTENPKPIAEQDITVDGSFTYNGSAQTPTVTVKDKTTGAALEAGTDYKVTYKQGSQEVASPKDAGTYTVVITAVDGSKYTGQDSSNTFTINQATTTIEITGEGSTAANPVVLDLNTSSTATGGISDFICFTNDSSTDKNKVHPTYTAQCNGKTVEGTLKFANNTDNNTFKVTEEKASAAYVLTFEPTDTTNYATVTGSSTTGSVTAPVIYVQVKDTSTDVTDASGTATIKNPADKTSYKITVSSSNSTSTGDVLKGATVSFSNSGVLTVKSPNATEDAKDFTITVQTADDTPAAKGGVSVTVKKSTSDKINSGTTATSNGQFRAHNGTITTQTLTLPNDSNANSTCTGGGTIDKNTTACSVCTTTETSNDYSKVALTGHTLETYGQSDIAYHCTKCDHVLFGNYAQTAAGTDSTLIEWKKLGTAGSAASGRVASGTSVQTLISLQGLDAVIWNKYYSDGNSWNSTSNIRTWLNGTFYKDAFKTEEQAHIASTDLEDVSSTGDKVFLLSTDEATKLFTTDTERVCCPTALATTAGKTNSGNACYAYNNAGYWWLRSPGNGTDNAAYVEYNGLISAFGGVNCDNIAARPVINLLI